VNLKISAIGAPDYSRSSNLIQARGELLNAAPSPRSSEFVLDRCLMHWNTAPESGNDRHQIEPISNGHR
jgi:hypothetical protein